MFHTGRRALMLGDQPAQDKPIPGHVYAFCIDVAGQDEALMSNPEAEILYNPGRDAITLTIYDIDLSGVPELGVPTYRVVNRKTWTGLNHIVIFGKLAALGDIWKPLHWVMDASGVGEGLWALLNKKFPTRIIPIKFTAGVKSEIGYGYLAIIETGRYRDCCPSPEVDKQYTACQAETLTGPAKLIRWGVPDGTRDPETGDLLHDDIILADALCSELDKLTWSISIPTAIIPGLDPITKEMDRNF